MKNKFKVGQKVKYKSWGNKTTTGVIEKINDKHERSLKIRVPGQPALAAVMPKNIID